MSFTYKTGQSQEEMLRRANAHLKATGYKIKTKGYVLEGTNGRDFSTAWCILFFALGIIPFLIYWFTRKKNRITFDVSTLGSFTVTYDGSKAVAEAERLANMFKA